MLLGLLVCADSYRTLAKCQGFFLESTDPLIDGVGSTTYDVPASICVRSNPYLNSMLL